jgi:hypothetical protein
VSAVPATPPLPLFLYSLCLLYSANFLQAAATLQLKPRPIWLASFLEASQPKLQHLDAQQLASLASAVATLSASAAAPGTSKEQQPRDSGARVSGSWVKVWMDCSKLRLSELQQSIREQEQEQAKQAAAAAADASDGTPAEAAQEKGGKAVAAAAGVAASPAPGVLIGQLALSAVELGVLSKPLPIATAAKGSAGGVLPQSFGPTTAERVAWVAALAAAAATAAAAVRTKALNAASASQILSALTAQQQEQPGLLQQLDAQFKQQAGSNSAASYVLSVVAAVASAAKGSMWSGGWEVLVRLLRAMMVFGVQPGGCYCAEVLQDG